MLFYSGYAFPRTAWEREVLEVKRYAWLGAQSQIVSEIMKASSSA